LERVQGKEKGRRKDRSGGGQERDGDRGGREETGREQRERDGQGQKWPGSIKKGGISPPPSMGHF